MNVDNHMEKIKNAREAILFDLEARFVAKDQRVKRICAGNGSLTGAFFSGSGTIKCPCCADGHLHYSRAASNGHVHATCTTEDCVRWME